MDEIKNLRQKEKLTVKQMSAKLGISESLYQKLECGARNPSINVIKRLKEVYPQLDANIFFE